MTGMVKRMADDCYLPSESTIDKIRSAKNDENETSSY